MAFRMWIYHQSEQPQIIESDCFDGMKLEGWSDTPATFLNLDELGIDKDDPVKVQQFGESVEGVKEALNAELNINIMSKADLIAYAKDHLHVEFEDSISLKLLRKKVKEIGEADVGN